MGVRTLHWPAFQLGRTQFSQQFDDIWVANMVAQMGVGQGTDRVHYDALGICMEEVGKKCVELKASIHCPKFGSGLAGGDWIRIDEMIGRLWVDRYALHVTVYDYSHKR